MTQIWLVARMDWRRLARERTAWAIVAVVIALLGAASWTGLARHAEAHAATAQAEARDAAMRRALAAAVRVPARSADAGWTLRNPDYLANDRGTTAVSRVPPLVTLSVGHAPTFATAVKVTAAGPPTGTAMAELAHPLSQTLGPFDVAFVIICLWPLAIAALAGPALAQERAAGTLRLLLVQPVTPRRVLAGLMLSRGSVLLAPALIVPAVATRLASSGLPFVELGAWSLVVIVYGVCWLSLAAWAASLGRSADTTVMWLGGAWLVAVLALPAAATLAASVMAPVPSDVAFAVATRAATRDALADGSRVLGHFLEDHPTAAAVGRDGLRQYALLQAARDQEVARRLAPVLHDFDEAVVHQRAIIRMVGALSPAMIAGELLQEAAGTSSQRGRHLLDQVQRFRVTWQSFFTPRILDGGALTVADAAAIPAFVDQPERWGAVLARTAPSAIWMVVLGLAFGEAAARLVARAPLGGGRS